MNNPTERTIGNIYNYYGSLSIKIEDNKYFWTIENWDGKDWEEISEHLYLALIKFDPLEGDDLTFANVGEV